MPDHGATRHDARERALGLLYEAELKDLSPTQLLAELPVPPDDYTAAIVEGVDDHGAELDATIRRLARNWDLERMATLDRAVLRIALFELAHRPDVPRGVILNEAVELAKTFSTEESGRFVNGVLAAAADEVRPTA